MAGGIGRPERPSSDVVEHKVAVALHDHFSAPYSDGAGSPQRHSILIQNKIAIAALQDEREAPIARQNGLTWNQTLIGIQRTADGGRPNHLENRRLRNAKQIG